VLSALSLSAQKIKADEVTAAVKSAFGRGSPGKSAAWWSKSGNDQYDATVFQPMQQTLCVAFAAGRRVHPQVQGRPFALNKLCVA
jgi:hypothetical protein